MADAATPFVMYGARDAIGAGLAHVEQQVRSIEQAVDDNPGLAFDLAKTLVESVCRTILDERSMEYDESDDLPRLFKLAATRLPFLPPAASGESQARESLNRTLSGLNTTIQGICELRNRCGFASHGSGNPRPAMESVQAQLAAQAADTIVGFLYRVHRQDRTPAPSPRTLYDENPIFNDYVDDIHEMIRIFEVDFRPSEVLFQVEPESYRVYLADFDTETQGREQEGKYSEIAWLLKSRIAPTWANARPLTGLPNTYAGRDTGWSSGSGDMTEHGISEAVIEQASLAWLESLGWVVRPGAEIAPGEPNAERDNYEEVVLQQRLRDTLFRLNPGLPVEALEEAFRRLTRPEGADLMARNRTMHRLLIDGVTVEYRADDEIHGAQVQVIDFDDPTSNDWLAVSQFSVVENKRTRRPDVVLFVNGLPLALMEHKNAADEDATIWKAYQQLQTYQTELPSLFEPNAILVISDGVAARVGTLGAGREWFKPWRTITGESPADPYLPELQVVIEGVFAHHRFLDIIRDFIVFEDEGGGLLTKKMAGYHQFHAVQAAIDETLRAAELRRSANRVDGGLGGRDTALRPGGEPGDRRIGVVWHTQGSGKSLTMAFYAGRIIREPAMENPTLVVLTDRNDLDDQLFGTFARCRDLLRQPPVQAESRADLRERLRVESGGVIFTTIHKFFPEEKGDQFPVLSSRRNIVVIADEAHRSQYDFVDGFARHMRDALPGASFIGFTGTPIELRDANTRAVFGDYISVYDIKRAVEDGATVPIYYESRLAQLDLDEAERPRIDPDFEEATEGEEVERKERLKTKWAQLEVIVGAEQRIDLIANDIIEHFERRLEAMDGKAMVVCMSRRICVALYRAIVELRPDWQDDDDGRGIIKVVMTGSASDPLDWQQHIRSKARREAIANRFRDPSDPLKVVLVRDMWLTGFDAPSLHTMYMDKPMRGHGLMQAIARVNRVFLDKPGGLVVDYLGLAHELREALATYTEAGGAGRTALDQEEAVTVMIEKYEICCGLFYGFDWSAWLTGSPGQRLGLLPEAQEHILAQENGKDRLIRATRELSQAFALAVPRPEALRIRDDVAFFQAVRAVLAKRAPGDARPDEDLDHAVRQIVSKAIASEGMMDIFAAAGLAKPDISILSDDFLSEVRGMPQRNLAIEVLQKLLKSEIRRQGGKNVVQARSFAQMLEQSLRRYQNRSIEAAQIIEQLIGLAQQIREAERRGVYLGLSDEEMAFYDALGTNDSAVAVLGDETLRGIAHELVNAVRANVTIDWAVRENVRAQLRVIVKRILRKHGYPPDMQERATRTVLEQAEVLSQAWVTT